MNLASRLQKIPAMMAVVMTLYFAAYLAWVFRLLRLRERSDV